ncbi:MAG: YggS family pyridoxal phosphate-dependent enzyme [Ignavibacteriae bacterium]|nr:YggS family pyridoxal phosphate-dependent enzyme [Ignavibacteriota bacterium]
MIRNNIQQIKGKIADKCLKIGRKPEEITLVAVSKQNPLSSIIEAAKYNILDFGENKAQELKQKTSEFIGEINWHFIGHLQTNKVKDIISSTYLIHSVDSIKLAKEINKRAENIKKIQNVLIEVNTSGEESKFGLNLYDKIFELAEFCKSCSKINLMGLMTMAPFTDDEIVIRNSFRNLKNIFEKLNSEGFTLTELSMGMTNDFEIAIEEGATILRIGTAIFRN